MKVDDRQRDFTAAHVKFKTAIDLIRWAQTNAVHEVIPKVWFDETMESLKTQADRAWKESIRKA